MNIQNFIQGLHHVTATVSDAQEDYDFYTKLLGLRLVKKTVNFDNNQVYHFYYGNEAGTPGTIMTTFPYRGYGVRQGRIGPGQVAITSFSVPMAALDFWQSRLQGAGVSVQALTRFGQPTLRFLDPAGLVLELVGDDDDARTPWTTTQVEAAVAIRGFHHVVLSIAEVGPTFEFLEKVFGFERVGVEGQYTRFAAQGGGAGQWVDVRHDGDHEKGINGLGTVHHVAWRIADEAQQLELRRYLTEQLGFKVTEVKDRNYFRSIYFRIPGGVLFEVATIPPGFTVDEPLEALGQELKLPEWEEPQRAQIESVLPKLV